ncbi:uncharacterized protein LOC115217412 [Argonauta hians]
MEVKAMLPAEPESTGPQDKEETDPNYFSTYIEDDGGIFEKEPTESDKKESTDDVKKYFEKMKYKSDFDFWDNLSEEEYYTYYEGFKEIRRLDQILIEKIEREREVKKETTILQKKLLQELDRIKKMGRIEMRDEKINTEKFFALNWRGKNSHNTKDNSEGVFLYHPFFQKDLEKPKVHSPVCNTETPSTAVVKLNDEKSCSEFDIPDSNIDTESVRSIQQAEVLSIEDAVYEPPVRKVHSIQDSEDLIIDGLLQHNPSIVGKVLNQRKIDAPLEKTLSIMGAKELPTDVGLKAIEFTEQTTSNLISDELDLCDEISDTNLSFEFTTQENNDSTKRKVTTIDSFTSEDSNILESTKEMVTVSNSNEIQHKEADPKQSMETVSTNEELEDVIPMQVELYDAKSKENVHSMLTNQESIDIISDQEEVLNSVEETDIISETPGQTATDLIPDELMIDKSCLELKLIDESPEISKTHPELESDQIFLTNEPLDDTVFDRSIFNEDLDSNKNDGYSPKKKKTKKNFIKRNIQLAKDADSAVAMTDDEKSRIDNLLVDLDTFCESPRELLMTDLASVDSLLTPREDGFHSSREDKASLAEIDFKLRHLMSEPDLEMVPIRSFSPPTLELSQDTIQDTYNRAEKKFQDKSLLENKEIRNNKERLKQIDERLKDIASPDHFGNGDETPSLKPETLQRLLESSALSIAETAAAESQCSTYRSVDEVSDITSLSQQTASEALSSLLKSPPCLADDVLQKLLEEAAPRKYAAISPISDITNLSDSPVPTLPGKSPITSVRTTPTLNRSLRTTPTLNQSLRSTPTLNQSVENSPRFNESVGNSPRFNESVGNSPRFNESVENSHRFNESVGNSPRFNESIGNSPRLNQCMGDTPKFNQSRMNTPTLKNSQKNSPRSNQSVANTPTFNNDIVEAKPIMNNNSQGTTPILSNGSSPSLKFCHSGGPTPVLKHSEGRTPPLNRSGRSTPAYCSPRKEWLNMSQTGSLSPSKCPNKDQFGCVSPAPVLNREYSLPEISTRSSLVESGVNPVESPPDT